MTTASSTRTATSQRSRTPETIAVVSSAGVMALEAVDAFYIEQPLGAITAIVVFGAGIVWLLRQGGRAPATYLGLFFALEILGNFTIFGVTDELRLEESWGEFASGLGYTVVTIAGFIACAALVRAPSKGSKAA